MVLMTASGTLAGTHSTPSNDEIRALVSEMMADASSRSSLLQSGGNAGHDGQFFLADTDGNFRLNIDGQVQFRYTANFGDSNAADGDDFTGGFQTARTKLGFSGNVIDKNIFYRVQGAFGHNGGNFTLEDAYVGYKFGNGFTMIWGQMKAPFLREELVSSSRQLAADRSLTNEVFNQGRSQGIQLAYKAEDWRMQVAITDGFNSASTDFNQDPHFFGAGPSAVATGGESDFAITGRAEFKLAGDWKQFKDFTSKPGSDYAMMIGVAAHYQTSDSYVNGAFGFGGPESSFTAYTIDFSVEGDGWNFFAAIMGSSTDFEEFTDFNLDGDPDSDFDDFGIVVQAGMFIPDTDWEVFVRWDGIFADDSERGGEEEFNTLTFGVNWYWSGHAAKFTLDAQIFLDESLGANGNNLASPNDGIGFIGAAHGEFDAVPHAIGRPHVQMTTMHRQILAHLSERWPHIATTGYRIHNGYRPLAHGD